MLKLEDFIHVRPPSSKSSPALALHPQRLTSCTPKRGQNTQKERTNRLIQPLFVQGKFVSFRGSSFELYPKYPNISWRGMWTPKIYLIQDTWDSLNSHQRFGDFLRHCCVPQFSACNLHGLRSGMPKTGMVDCVSCISSRNFFGVERWQAISETLQWLRLMIIIFCGDFRAGMYQVFRACDLLPWIFSTENIRWVPSGVADVVGWEVKQALGDEMLVAFCISNSKVPEEHE